MKELDSFTVEQLTEFVESDHAQCGDVSALARIALAAKRAEPVTWWTGPEPTLTGELESFHDHETGSHYLPLISLSTTSYAALSREKFIFKVTNFLCTRRQSIAREGETAALIYDMVTTPQLNSPQGWIKCSDQMPEVGDVVITAYQGCTNVGEMERSGKTYRYFTSIASGRELPVTHWMPLPAAPEKENG
jgi:hypothetical protein